MYIDRDVINKYRSYLNFDGMVMDNGMKVIRVSAFSTIAWGGFGICDYCGKKHEHEYYGYYIPVLNSWYCQECFDEFAKKYEYYEEDREITELRYRGRIDMLRNIQNMNTVELVDLIKSVLL